jgi:hypothetical protein
MVGYGRARHTLHACSDLSLSSKHALLYSVVLVQLNYIPAIIQECGLLPLS